MKLLTLATLIFLSGCAGTSKHSSQELDYCTQVCAQKGMRLTDIKPQLHCECAEQTPSNLHQERLFRDRN